MITALDTNVLLDILAPNAKFVEGSEKALEDAAASGSLVVSEIGYAELCGHFRSQRECDDFLDSIGIRVEPVGRQACFLASRAWREYRQRGGKRARILSDFLIGAHAVNRASQLLSRDRGFYREMFPSLRVVDPSTA